jgi:hypothetical protein
MRRKLASPSPIIADTLESMREMPLRDASFGQLLASDDDGELTWGFRAQFVSDTHIYLARLTNTTGGSGASCVVTEEPDATVLAFERYVLQPEFSRWVSIAAVLNIELMHTALVQDAGALNLVAYVRHAGRVRTDAFLLDINSGAISEAANNHTVTTFSGFRLGLLGASGTVQWVFRTHRREVK